MGDLAGAVPFLQRALAIDPLSHEVGLTLCDVYARLGQTERAIDVGKRALASLKLPHTSRINALRFLWKLEHPERPLALEQAARLSDKGMQAANEGRAEYSYEMFRAATEADPTDGEAWNNRGSAASSMGDLNEALECFEQGLTLYPGFSTLLENRCRALFALGRLEEALLACEAWIRSINPPREPLAFKQRILQALGR